MIEIQKHRRRHSVGGSTFGGNGHKRQPFVPVRQLAGVAEGSTRVRANAWIALVWTPCTSEHKTKGWIALRESRTKSAKILHDGNCVSKENCSALESLFKAYLIKVRGAIEGIGNCITSIHVPGGNVLHHDGQKYDCSARYRY